MQTKVFSSLFVAALAGSVLAQDSVAPASVTDAPPPGDTGAPSDLTGTISTPDAPATTDPAAATSAPPAGDPGLSTSAPITSAPVATSGVPSATTSLPATATGVTGTVHNVTVGMGGLMFTPSSITAAQGDVINFMFYPNNHTVTQSTFANPCSPMAGGMDSGFKPSTMDLVNAGTEPMYSLTVANASSPMWFMCMQTGHCEKGMVFAVNPTAAKSFAAFQAMAMNSTSSMTNTTTSGSSSGGYGSGAASLASGAGVALAAAALSAFALF